MAEAATKLPVQSAEKPAAEKSEVQARRPFESLRREIDRLFDNFDHDMWRAPFRRSLFDAEPLWRRELSWSGVPAVDIVEKDKAFEIKADLPGYDEKDIEVKLVNGGVTIKGERKEEKEEKRKGYYLHERQAGSFERTFRVPEGVDGDKIEAHFAKGVLTLTLPKKPEAQKPEKKIEIKAA
jgi:HSP20 family protein